MKNPEFSPGRYMLRMVKAAAVRIEMAEAVANHEELELFREREDVRELRASKHGRKMKTSFNERA